MMHTLLILVEHTNSITLGRMVENNSQGEIKPDVMSCVKRDVVGV